MMKKFYFLSAILLFFTSLINAQLQNASFEIWEDVGLGMEEPVNWSSTRTTDNPWINTLAPTTWEKYSEDVHTGEYCIKLFNVYSEAAGLVVAGGLTNGKIHAELIPDNGYIFTDQSDSSWNTPINYIPDSIAFWVKFYPQETDTIVFQAIIHNGEGTIPLTLENTSNRVAQCITRITGVYEEWTRFSIPFLVYNQILPPEYILIGFSSGSTYEPVEGSWGLFDDVELIGGEQSVFDNELSKTNAFIKNDMLYLNNLSGDILKNCEVQISDVKGILIFKDVIDSSPVNLNKKLQSGIYIITLITEKQVASKKVYVK